MTVSLIFVSALLGHIVHAFHIATQAFAVICNVKKGLSI